MAFNRLSLIRNSLNHLNLNKAFNFHDPKITSISSLIYSTQSQRIIKCFSNQTQVKSNKETTSPFSFQTLSDTNNPNEISSQLKQKYETIAEETLESLSDKFDSLTEELDEIQSKYYDVEYSSGVLNVKLGPKYGTYVLNKQTPNLQIWLSSPTSGPKRFDFIDNTWVYKRTNESLHELLNQEISKCFNKPIDFSLCSYGKRK